MEQLVKFLGSLQSYFNDFLGAIAPAVVLLVCVPFVSGISFPQMDSGFWGGFLPLAGCVVLFAVGHLLSALAEKMRQCRLGPKEWWGFPGSSLEMDSSRKEFVRLLQMKGLSSDAPLQPNVIRNIAMTISDDGRELGRRFRFLALFCYGSATALLMSAVIGVGVSIFYAANTWPYAAVSWGRASMIAIATGGWWMLLVRGLSFEERAFSSPISAAIAELLCEHRNANGSPEHE